MLRSNRAFAPLLMMLVTAGTALSQGTPDRVARLAYSQHTLFRPAGFTEEVPAELNRPLTTADHLWTEAQGRAELETNNAEIRLNGRTGFTFLNLNDAATQIELTSGGLSVRLHTLASNEAFEVDTPQLALTLGQPGDYRVEVDDDSGVTTVTVRRGAGLITYGQKALQLAAGLQVRVTVIDNPSFLQRIGLFTSSAVALLTGGDATLSQSTAPPRDGFDEWCKTRADKLDASEAAQYVSRDVPGFADLDGQGEWRYSSFGWTWVPRNTPDGWVPFRYGRWTNVEPWGWTWIDSSQWGFATSHYGNWAYVDGTWGWVPGDIVARPHYSPATVAFATYQPGVVIYEESVVAWFPLTIGELVRFGVNYALRFIGGTAIRQSAFANGGAADASLDVNKQAQAQAQPGSNPGVNPTKSAALGPNAPIKGTEPTKGNHVVTRTPPPAAPPHFTERPNVRPLSAQPSQARSTPMPRTNPGSGLAPKLSIPSMKSVGGALDNVRASAGKAVKSMVPLKQTQPHGGQAKQPATSKGFLPGGKKPQASNQPKPAASNNNKSTKNH